MSELAAAVSQLAFQQNPDSQSLKSQTNSGKRSFEQVLQDGNKNEQVSTENKISNPAEGSKMTTGVSGAKLEQMRLELMQRIDQLNPGQTPPPTKSSDILPDLFYTKNRMGLLKEAMNGLERTPKGEEIFDMFTRFENEHKQIEGIMKSNKDLSPGELLGLQARLYQVSQHIEVMSKVVDQMTSGIKTILNTNV